VLVAKSEPKAEEGRLDRAGLTVCKRRRRRIWQSACDVHAGSARTVPDPEIITEWGPGIPGPNPARGRN